MKQSLASLLAGAVLLVACGSSNEETVAVSADAEVAVNDDEVADADEAFDDDGALRLSGRYFPGRCRLLPNADCAGVFLQGFNLGRVDLRGANLAGADLSYSNLADSSLAGANLTQANLAGANLDRVDLTNSNLEGANLAGANLSGANWGSARLCNTMFPDGSIQNGSC